MPGEVLVVVIPKTVPPVPDDVRLLMVLLEIVRGLAALPEEPMLIPVIAPVPVKLLMVLFEMMDAEPPQ